MTNDPQTDEYKTTKELILKCLTKVQELMLKQGITYETADIWNEITEAVAYLKDSNKKI